jgi:hypothetical protein
LEKGVAEVARTRRARRNISSGITHANILSNAIERSKKRVGIFDFSARQKHKYDMMLSGIPLKNF